MRRLVPFLLLLSLSAASLGLRITEVTFPSYVMLDQTVTLVCDYRVSEVRRRRRISTRLIINSPGRIIVSSVALRMCYKYRAG